MTSGADRPKTASRKTGLVAAAAAALATPIALAPPAEAAPRPHAVEAPHKHVTPKTAGHVVHTNRSGAAKTISWRNGSPKSISWGRVR